MLKSVTVHRISGELQPELLQVLINRRINMGDHYMEDWIGIEAASKYLDVTKDTVRNWIKKTDIPAHKVGKLWKFKRIELDAWVKSGHSAID